MTEDKECREEFELWARDNGYVVTRALDGEWYSQQGTDRAWDVWQACWSRAAKPAVPEGLVELLRELRPNYGDVGSRDVDVAEKQRKIDAAIALLSAAPPLPVVQGVPEGHAIVPKEPTTDIGWAYLDAARAEDPTKSWAFSWPGYRAAIAVASKETT